MTTNDNSFSYTIFIRTTPKKLWNALTDTTQTKKWWRVAHVTDWKRGSTYVLKQNGVTIKDPEQVIVESTPHARLAYTWHTFSPAVGSVERLRRGDPAPLRERGSIDDHLRDREGGTRSSPQRRARRL